MSETLAAHEALCRLLASAWDPAALPQAVAVPWAEVLRLAGPTNLAGLLYELSAELRPAMPADVRRTLENAHYATIAANVRAEEELAQLGAALARVGAPVMLLKGAALAQTLYAPLPPRAIGDLDLVVPRAAYPLCQQALLELGYLPDEIEARPGTQLAYRSQELFRPPAPLQTVVELHWHILDVPYYMYSLPMDWFWEHSRALTLGGQPFQVLDDTANLVYLPAHLALHHQFQRLHTLFDLALLVAKRGAQLDWAASIGAARSLELAAALREALERVAGCWPTLPLDEPRRLLAANPPAPNDERMLRLLSGSERGTPLNIYSMLLALPSLPARARYLWDNVFPQPAYMRARYRVRGDWQLPYWYAYRFGEGLVRFARALPRVWRSDRGRG